MSNNDRPFGRQPVLIWFSVIIIALTFPHIAQGYKTQTSSTHTVNNAAATSGDEAKSACEQWLDSHGYTDSDCNSGTVNGIFLVEAAHKIIPKGSIPPNVKHESFIGRVNDDKRNNSPSCAGNPISLPNGTKTQFDVDYRGAGILPLQITRTYNSQANVDEREDGWRFYFGNQFRLDPFQGDRRVLVRYSDNSYVIFTSIDGNSWTSDLDVTIELKREMDGASHIGWIVTSDNDQVETFDLDGQHKSVQYRGKKHIYSYDAANSTTTIEDTYGKTLVIVRDSSGRVLNVTNPAGDLYVYAYDPDGSLEFVTYPDDTPGLADNPKRQYHYEDSSTHPTAKYWLTGITDENNVRFATWAYDTTYPGGSPRATLSKHALGAEEVNISYEPGSNFPTVINSYGKHTEYEFAKSQDVNRITSINGQASENCAATTQSITYTDGFPEIITDAEGNQTKFEYVTDANESRNGLEQKRIEAFNDSGIGSVKRTITTTWEPVYRLPNVVTEFTATDLGIETDYDYDSNGNLDKITRKNLSTTEIRETDYQYSPLGQLLSVNGPRTDLTTGNPPLPDDVTVYSYYSCADGQGKCGQIEKITNALGHETSFTGYNAHGQPTHITDPNGVEYVLTYDKRQRLVSFEVDAAVGGGQYMTQLGYDAVGQITLVTMPNSSTLTLEYDDAQRLEKIIDTLGNYIKYTLDSEGKATAIEIFDDQLVLQKTQTAAFDELGRLIKTVGANLQEVNYSYDLNNNTETMAAGINPATTYLYDALDRVAEITDPVSGSTGTTHIEYDHKDRVTKVTDPDGLITTYAYNGFGDMVTLVSTDTGTTSYVHDKAGNVTSKTDARAVVSHHTYDSLNRKTSTTYPADTTNAYAEYFVYDLDDLGNKGIGRLTYFQDVTGNNYHYYNSRGLITYTQTNNVFGQRFHTGYSYDDSGQLTQIIYPSGRLVNYQYDAANRIDKVTHTRGSDIYDIAKDVQYRPFGPMSQITYGNDLVKTHVIDQDYRIEDIDLASLMDRHYSYDSSNNISAIGDLIDPTKTQDFVYDYLDRLTDADGKYGDIDYEYSPGGDRNKVTLVNSSGTATDDYNYDPLRPHILDDISGSNPRDFVTDPAGNATLSNGLTHTYDFKGRRLVQSASNTTHYYFYNAIGQRAIKITPIEVIHYLYDLQGQLLSETYATNNMGKEYAFLNGQPLATWHIEGQLAVLAAPVITPASGSYPNSVQVFLDQAPPGVTYYYTIDAGQSYVEYTGPFTLTTTADVSAVATRAFHEPSAPVTHNYVITSGSQAMSSGGGSLFGSAANANPVSPPINPGGGKPKPFKRPTARAADKATKAGRTIPTNLIRSPASVLPILEAAEQGLMEALQ